MYNVCMSVNLETFAKLEPSQRRALVEDLVFRQFAPRVAVHVHGLMNEVKKQTIENAQITALVGRPTLIHPTFTANMTKPVHELYQSLCTLLDAYD